MTIDEMPAGREMDALVAEKVMGWCNVKLHLNGWLMGTLPNQPDDFVPTPAKHYSTDITAAWEVVEKLRLEGIYLWRLGREDVLPDWVADFGENHKPSKKAIANTAPLAICRAALKAAGV